MAYPTTTSGHNANGLGLDPLTTDTLGTTINKFPQFALGTRMAGDGDSEWIYVKASAAVTGAGYVCVVDEAYNATMANSTNALYGMQVAVPGVAFASGDYGWMQIRGTCVIYGNAAAAANTKITSTATDGQLDDAAGVGTKTINNAAFTTAVGGAAATAAAVVYYPTVGATN